MARTMQRALEAQRSGRADDVRRSRTSLIDIPELATELGVKISYVRRLVHQRRIPYIKVGRLVRFDPIEVEAWLAEGRVDALW